MRTESGLAREKQPKATGKPAAGTSIGPKAEACVSHWRTIGIEALPSGEGPLHLIQLAAARFGVKSWCSTSLNQVHSNLVGGDVRSEEGIHLRVGPHTSARFRWGNLMLPRLVLGKPSSLRHFHAPGVATVPAV